MVYELRVSDDHVTMPLNLPALDHLSTEEVGQLRAKLSAASRDARKRATLLLGRQASLKKPWGRSLTMNKNTSAEERAEIQRDLERALLRVPEAYLAHAWANSLVTLDTHCREELLRRTGSAQPKKKALAEAMVAAAPKCVLKDYPSAPPPPAPKPPEEPDADALDGDALAAMFDQAGDE